MNRLSSLYRSSIGKKVVMAVTGFGLVAYLFVHLLGNLKIYSAPKGGEYAIDVYGQWLRDLGHPILGPEQGIWLFRFGLLAVALLHVWSSIAVWRMSRAARPEGYRRWRSSTSTWSSRTMRFGGVFLAVFTVVHILHLTTGHIDPTGTFVYGEVHRNMVDGFRVWWVTLFYLVAMGFLALHLHHGIWSAFQSLGIANPRHKQWRQTLAMGATLVITIGLASIPLAVFLGFVGNGDG